MSNYGQKIDFVFLDTVWNKVVVSITNYQLPITNYQLPIKGQNRAAIERL